MEIETSYTSIAVFKNNSKENLNFSNEFPFFKIHIVTSTSVFLLHRMKHFVCFYYQSSLLSINL